MSSPNKDCSRVQRHHEEPHPRLRRIVAGAVGAVLVGLAAGGSPFIDHDVHEDLKRMYANEKVVSGLNPYARIASSIAQFIATRSINKNQAREVLAAQRFQDPRITAATEAGEVSDGRNKVTLKLSLPGNPLAQAAETKYARSNAVSWSAPGLTSAAIAKDNQDKYILAGPGFAQPPEQTLTIKDGTATAEVYPLISDRPGTQVALFAIDTASTERMGDFVQTTGSQYLGTLKLVTQDGHKQWVIAPGQPTLPDTSSTTITPFEN